MNTAPTNAASTSTTTAAAAGKDVTPDDMFDAPKILSAEEKEWRDKVEELFTKLSNLRAQAFESSPHPSLKAPALTATIRFDDGKTETVTFGRTDRDVFGARADEAGAARLDASAFDEAIKALDAVK